MLARTPWGAMNAPQLITHQMAEGAALRHWGAHEARRVALAVVWGRYSEADALAELAAALAWHAERAKIHSVSCRALAASMLEDELEALDERHNAVRRLMIEAAEKCLRADPTDKLTAAYAAADIARAENVPPNLIDAAFNIALWRTRRRA